MGHTPHELAEEFPEYSDRIHQLKLENGHFATLADRYHELNRKIHRAETHVEPTDEAHEAEMRRERLALKDQIWQFLKSQDG